MRAVHERNADRLYALLQPVGWPPVTAAGQAAVAAAWLVVQHAISRPAVMRAGLAMLQAAPDPPDLVQVAMLHDRIAVLEGRPQRYGTQYDWGPDGLLHPAPVADPVTLDERRAALGLRPQAEHTERMRAQAAAEGQTPPADWAAYQAAQAAFRAECGWR